MEFFFFEDVVQDDEEITEQQKQLNCFLNIITYEINNLTRRSMIVRATRIMEDFTKKNLKSS